MYLRETTSVRLRLFAFTLNLTSESSMSIEPELRTLMGDKKCTASHQHTFANIIISVLAVLVSLSLVGCAKKETPKQALPDVEVASVQQQDVPAYGEWVAQLNGPVNAEITPKVQGYLLKQNYRNGFFLRKGQLLFELDP